MQWNNTELFNLVQENYGEEQANRMRPSLYSIPLKFYQINYHAEKTLSILREALPPGDEKEYVRATRAILNRTSNEGKRYSLAKFESEAHIIACGQAMHSIADIMAAVCYYALNIAALKKKKIKEERINLWEIRKLLITNTPFEKLCALLGNLLESDEFKYLSAYVNTTKHRNLVDDCYTVCLEQVENPKHGIKISGFQYRGDMYFEKWADIFIKKDIQYIKAMIIKIGNELNRLLKDAKTEKDIG